MLDTRGPQMHEREAGVGRQRILKVMVRSLAFTNSL